MLAFLAVGIHSALHGDPPRPFVENRYKTAGTAPSTRDVMDQEKAVAYGLTP
jgi:hypothetical protein